MQQLTSPHSQPTHTPENASDHRPPSNESLAAPLQNGGNNSDSNSNNSQFTVTVQARKASVLTRTDCHAAITIDVKACVRWEKLTALQQILCLTRAQKLQLRAFHRIPRTKGPIYMEYHPDTLTKERQ